MKNICLICALFLTFAAIPSSAEELNYNIIRLSQSIDKKIPNDLLKVVLEARSQADTSPEAAGRVNEDMSWALALVAEEKTVKAENGSYSTFPQYSNGNIIGYTVSQTLELESINAEILMTLAGRLQQKLQLQDMNFTIRKETRREALQELIVLALKGFMEKARLIVATMGGKDYKVVEATVSEGAQMMPVMFSRSFATAESRALKDGSSPVAEPGDSTVTVTVQGSVQVVY